MIDESYDELWDGIRDLAGTTNLDGKRYILAYSINEDPVYSCPEQLENAESFLRAGETFCVLTNTPVKPNHPLLKVMRKYGNETSGIIVMQDPEYVQKIGLPVGIDIIVQTLLGESEMVTNTNGNTQLGEQVHALGADGVIERLKRVWGNEKKKGTPVNIIQSLKGLDNSSRSY